MPSEVKREDHIVSSHDLSDLAQVTPGAEEIKAGTQFDQRDMVRMGKVQELKRQFQFFSIWGYAVILGLSWEYALITGVLSLPNGGTAGAVWMFLATCIGMFFVMLSMAEMASMAPVCLRSLSISSCCG